MTKKITNILLKLIFITFSFYCFCLAQTDTITSKLNGYDKFVESLMKEWEIPGAAIAVVKDGHIVYAKGFGYRDLNNKLKVNTKTIFGIGSITKSFVAGSIGILQDEKRVHIDTPIIRYIPDFKLYDECMTKNMTLRDMLSHRSGLSGNNWLVFPKDRKEMTYQLRYEKPTKGFRESYQYNGTNITASANILEQITGKTWEDYVKENMFIPMEMPQSCFTFKNAEQNEDHSLAYYKKDGIVTKATFNEKDQYIWIPAGYMFSNVEDMSNWMITFLNKGIFKGRRIISESYIDEMIKPNISHELRPGIEELFANYGLCLHTSSFQGNLIVYHMGNYSGFTAQMLMHPESNTGIIVLTNMDSPTGVNALAFKALEKILDLKETDLLGKCREIKKIYQENDAKADLERQKNKDSNASLSMPLSKYLGKYNNNFYGDLEIVSENDTLKALFHGLKSNLFLFQNDIVKTDGSLRNAKISFPISAGEINGIEVIYDPVVDKILFRKVKK
jgi:CubicO group peptidase (beta-lactamase class C family)